MTDTALLVIVVRRIRAAVVFTSVSVPHLSGRASTGLAVFVVVHAGFLAFTAFRLGIIPGILAAVDSAPVAIPNLPLGTAAGL